MHLRQPLASKPMLGDAWRQEQARVLSPGDKRASSLRSMTAIGRTVLPQDRQRTAPCRCDFPPSCLDLLCPFHAFRPSRVLWMETVAKEVSGESILRYIAGNRECNMDIPNGAPNDKDLMMARLDAEWVAAESLDILICTVRGASSAPGSAPGSAVLSSAQPVAAPAKSDRTAVKIGLIVLAEFIWPPQYDGKSRSTFCILPSARLPFSFATSAP
jgi:hypothetical protein